MFSVALVPVAPKAFEIRDLRSQEAETPTHRGSAKMLCECDPPGLRPGLLI